MAVTYNPQHTWWDYPPVDDYPESGVHGFDCKWLCKGPPDEDILCRRRDHPECALCKSAAEKREASSR